jgi:phosphoribosylformylglycinamidine (FGAM) synthase PurS component
MKMIVTTEERTILRELAKQIAEIAALPVQQETVALWKSLNGLKPVRPMVMIDQVAWHEMNVNDELTLRTANPFCRDLETHLRRTLYAWKHMRVDMVVEPVVNISKVIRNTGMGIEVVEQKAVLDPNNDVVGHAYQDQLRTIEDVERIRTPKLELDEKSTATVEEMAHEIFDGLLTVRMQGMLPNFAPWDVIATWRGAQNVLFDMGDRPEFMHRIMSRLTDAYLAMLDQLEEQGLLGYGQATIHCSGAYTDELPAPGFDPRRPRARDLWTSGMAQIFAAVSPTMHQEFELDYAVRWYERFGLVYYGCCEPLHNKIDIVKRIPHVRKVSMSPWADVDKGAERIGKELVFSRKPNPAFLAGPTWDPDVVREDLRDTKERCARYGCPSEFILKDISTVCYQPQRLWEWADVAMHVVRQ